MKSKHPTNFILDVDGVMTSGSFIYSIAGKMYKIFGPHDHDGIKMLKNLIAITFVTADSTGFMITKKRIVNDMKQKLILLKENDRLKHLEENFDLENSIYMGDGYHDASILTKSLYGIAPNNARIEAKNAANYITPSCGGNGAVLDACLQIKKLFFSQSLQSITTSNLLQENKCV